ncbi:GspE/PulE family protein [Burkholderia vietnamiensis]|uniref:GspE/PulE family protein n=1 Tax=Burkholderia vietnamiensis TaxID=60552 RepID=UPI001D15176D|nr:ATPase, T2SS/T4P/T4SS family [Burkholderia vietnamiensis]UEC05542.1 Flp pilus assembly complex ATPase component TadA [Burkholderia vietnamiensis]
MDMSESTTVGTSLEERQALLDRFRPEADIADKVILISKTKAVVLEGFMRDQRVKSHLSLVERVLNTVIDVTSLPPDSFRQELGGRPTPGERSRAYDGDISTMQQEVMRITSKAVRMRASDIHLVNWRSGTRVRFRIDGVLRDDESIDIKTGTALCRTIYGSMLDQGEPEYKEGMRQDGRVAAQYSHSLGLQGIRVATRPLEDHNLFVMRLQHPGKAGRMTLPGLGYTDQHIRDFHQMMIRDGVNLLSGSTGSGKTTTMSVIGKMLLQMYKGCINLMTVEDPVEIEMHYDFGRAVQTPLGFNEPWADAITNLMRLDPDIMFIGEIRDLLAAMAAIQGAMTGHGLWTTTHAKHAWASLDRLNDLGVPMPRLSDASLFTGLINQALAPVLCTHEGCAKPYVGFKHLLREDVCERVDQFCDVDRVRVAAQPNLDCPHCGGLGYHDRTVLAEVVSPTQKQLDIFRVDGSAKARATWIAQGGRTALRHLIDKINAGQVDPSQGEEALRRPLNEDDLTTA